MGAYTQSRRYRLVAETLLEQIDSSHPLIG